MSKIKWGSFLVNLILGFSLAIFFVFATITRVPIDSFPLLNIFTPLVPYVLFCQSLVFAILILWKKWRWAATFIVVFITSIPNLSRTFGWGVSANEANCGLRVLSYNTSFFNVPTVFSSDYFSSEYNHRVLKTRSWIIDQKVDVIFLQEFFNDDDFPLYNTKEVMRQQGYEAFVYPNIGVKNNLQRGVAIFSRFPIIRSGSIVQSKNGYNASIYSDILIDSDTIRFINVHLRSTSFRGRRNGPLARAKEFISGYVRTSLERSQQIKSIVELIDHTPYPVVLGGDFNESPYSNSFRILYNRLENAHSKVGQGLGHTFNKMGLGVRIDHFFYSNPFAAKWMKTYQDVKLSEHKPICMCLSSI